MVDKLLEMIMSLKKQKVEITEDEMQKEIMRWIGSDNRTLKNCVRTMKNLNMIEEQNGLILLK